MTGAISQALRAGGVILVMFLGGCAPESAPPMAAGPVEAPGTKEGTTPAGPADQVELRAVSDLAAQSPLGRLRVAPVVDADGKAIERPMFRHQRGEGPDLLLAVVGPETGPVQWSASPGRLSAAAADGSLAVSVVAGRYDALYRFVLPPGQPLQLMLQWHDGDAAADLSLDPARGRRDLTGALELASGGALHIAARFDRAFDVVSADGQADSLGRRRTLRLVSDEGVIHLRLALSSVDLAAARAALGDQGFDYVAQWSTVRAAWNRLLQRVSVSGDDAQQSAVATSLYRVLAHVGDLSDVDGRYRAADGSIRRMPDGVAFIDGVAPEPEPGSAVPLLSLVVPEWMPGVAESLLARSRSNGRLPGSVQSVAGATDLRPALPMLASLVATAIPGVEAQRLLPPMLKSVTVPGGEWPWFEFQALGYFPYDRVAARSVSLTVEASRAHRAVAGVAAAVGDRAVAAEHATKTVFYRRLFNAEADRFCARNHAGEWRAGCALPADVGAGDAEEPEDVRRREAIVLWAPARFDIDGLITLFGGRQALARRLSLVFGDEVASTTAAGYDHAEPALHHVPWLYAFSNTPERTGPVVRRILEAAGPVASESVAQAAWRVFAVLGFYPVLQSQGEYVLGEPLVREARLRFGAGDLRIERSAVSNDGSAARILLDGVPVPGRTVTHRQLLRATVLRYDGSAASP